MSEARYFLVHGDSKTVTGATLSEWSWLYKWYAEQQTGVGWGLVANLATGGWTVANAAAAIDAQLAALDATPEPEIIMSNFGANDARSMPAEATYKANYLYMLDAFNTKYPNALVWIMDPWRRDEDADCITLAAWNADIVASRAFARKGPDEKVFLEAGDNGVTYTLDGAHPNTAGKELTAQQWISLTI